jgi:hypothetical protein
MLVLLVALAWIEVAFVQVAQYRIQPVSAEVPAAYRALAEAPPGGFLDVPLLPYDLPEGQHLYYQTAHGHPMLNYNFVSIKSMVDLGEKSRNNSILAEVLGESAVPRRADAEALSHAGFQRLILHTAVPVMDLQFDRPFLFDVKLFADLSRIYGAPQAMDDLLVFDMQHVQGGAWSPDGTLSPGGQILRPVSAFLSEPAGEARSRSLGMVSAPVNSVAPAAPVSPANSWLYGWLRGRGARLRALREGREMAASPAGDDAWRWMRLPVAIAAGPLELRLDLAAGEAAQISGLALERPAAGAAAR